MYLILKKKNCFAFYILIVKVYLFFLHVFIQNMKTLVNTVLIHASKMSYRIVLHKKKKLFCKMY